MSSIQERLQMKRVPLDTWSTQEKLCLASSVIRSGDQNWMSVSRALRSLGDPNRPPDWFSQKNCAAQYGSLLENVETPRRKKRVGEGATETPQENIVKKLTQHRIQELQKEMMETARAFAKTKEEIKELTSETVTESRIRELSTALENAKREKERGAARRAQWLREREQRRGLLERAWRRAEGAAAPLLTSLLQSPTHHHSAAQDMGSPSAGAPTLSLLLEKTSPLPVTSTEPPMLQPISDHKVISKSELLKIEQIKSELQEIEHQYRGVIPSDVLSNIPPLQSVAPPELLPSKDPPPTEKTPEKIEIDDIEIKAEDVYAFSDIDLDIPPVSSIHKSSLSRTLHSDKNLFNKREHSASIQSLEEVTSPSGTDSTEVLNSLLSPINVNENSNADLPTEGSFMINPPAVEFENPEEPATVDNEKIDGEIRENLETKSESEPTESLADVTIKQEYEELEPMTQKTLPEDEDSSDGEMNQKVADIKKDLDAKRSHEDLCEKSEVSEMEEDNVSTKEQTTEESSNMDSEIVDCSQAAENKESIAEAAHSEHHMEAHTETDDDTPIEVIKEDKPGKTKRDYSRKKTEKDEAAASPGEIEGVVSSKSEYSDEIGSDNSQGSTDKKSLSRRFRNEVSGSRSESPATPLDSLPGSPAPATPPPLGGPLPASSPAPEHEREYRTWKKAILLAYSRLNSLKYASLFLRPITDDQAPGYSQVVKKPMDLSTIRRNIDNGVIRTTKEFQRDVLLMMNNALMYNRSDHRVFAMARETLNDVHTQLNILLQAQGHVTLGTPCSRLGRPPYSLSRSVPMPQRRKRGGGETPTPN